LSLQQLTTILRVEKSDGVILRDVQITEEPKPEPDKKTNDISTQDLKEEKGLLQKSLARCELASTLLENGIKSMDLSKTSLVLLDEAVHAYDERAKAWDKKILELKREIREIDRRIQNMTNPPEETADARDSNEAHFSNHIIRFTLEVNAHGDHVQAEVRLVYCEFSVLQPNRLKLSGVVRPG
jgi:hypothetical protein